VCVEDGAVVVNIALMTEVENARGLKERKNLLSQTDHSTREFIRLATDPFITFGVTFDPSSVGFDSATSDFPVLGQTSSDKRVARYWDAGRWWDEYHTCLLRLADRKLTGFAAKQCLHDILGRAPTPHVVDWALRILNKDLRAGVGQETVCKVFPGLINPFRVPLAYPLDGDKHDFSGPALIEPKIDGKRLIVRAGDTLSRHGKHLYGVQHAVRELSRRIDLDRWVVDGEWIGEGCFEDTMSGEHSDLIEYTGTYNVFHLVPRVHWDGKTSKPAWQVKADVILHLSGMRLVRVVPHWLVYSATYEELVGWRDYFMSLKYEGAMWKSARRSLIYKRSTNILKVKKFDNIDVIAVDKYAGEPGTKYQDVLGGIVGLLPNGTTTNVGGGYTDKQRHEIWNNWAAYRGRTASIKFQNKTRKDNVRFADFVMWRDDKDASDDAEDRETDELAQWSKIIMNRR
jgi:hypothetical protein